VFGAVYRGKLIPELQGAYVYADYVSQRKWALRYDPARNRVTANHPITPAGIAALSFGEDDQGEMYVLSVSSNGQGIHRLVTAKK
jgi:hypothetical protein